MHVEIAANILNLDQLREPAATIARRLGQDVVRITSRGEAAGGTLLEVRDDQGQAWFCKTTLSQRGRDKERERALAAEATGLREMGASGTVRVPAVHHHSPGLLITTLIRNGPRNDPAMAVLGRELAAMHQVTADHWGFREDGFIGANPQINTPAQAADDSPDGGWSRFWFQYRMLEQLRLVEQRGGDPWLRRAMDRLGHRIGDLLATDEVRPRLLHGDLWSGNALVDDSGRPWVIDPAVYYGHREADLAMTSLFGGFPPAFYAAYGEVFPLSPGAGEREPLYQLYHVLNHYNLFGASWYARVKDILRRYCGP